MLRQVQKGGIRPWQTLVSARRQPVNFHVCRNSDKDALTTTKSPETGTEVSVQSMEDLDGDVQCVISGTEATCVSENGSKRNISTRSSILEQKEFGLDTLLQVGLLISPFFFWGTSMVAMKGVTSHTTPLFLGALRLLPAGVALVGWAQATGRPQPQTMMAWVSIAAFALVDGAAFQGFLAEGLNRTSAGLGSVIIDSQPLTVAVLAALLFGEELSSVAVVGLLVGVLGLSLLEVPPEVMAGALSGAGAPITGSWSMTSVLGSGEFFMLLAAQSMAVGTVMVRWVVRHSDPVMATGWHMVLGGVMLLGASLAGEADTLLPRLGEFSAHDALAMTYVSLLGGAASYGIFFYEASHGNLTALSSLTFLTPMFASIADYLVFNTTFTPLQITGALVTLGAVFMINTQPSSKSTNKDA